MFGCEPWCMGIIALAVIAVGIVGWAVKQDIEYDEEEDDQKN